MGRGQKANHEVGQQETQSLVKVPPTNVWARGALGIEDYRKNSCISIQHIKGVSRHFRWSEKRRDIADSETT